MSRETGTGFRKAGRGLQAARVVLMVVFVAFGVLAVIRSEWFLAALMLAGIAGAVAALRRGEAP